MDGDRKMFLGDILAKAKRVECTTRRPRMKLVVKQIAVK